MQVAAADEQDRALLGALCAEVQAVTGETATLAYVDQHHSGEAAARGAQGIALGVWKLPEAKRGSALLPRRWVLERTFTWPARFRRLARDYERLLTTSAGLHFAAIATRMLHRAATPVRAWLAKRPRYHVHFTPTYRSWLNPAERGIGLTTQHVIRRGFHRTVKEPICRIEAYVVHDNRTASPFMWTATADSILAKLKPPTTVMSESRH
jgi:hypothetical protein